MEAINLYDWTDFYEAFAIKLLAFKNDRSKLIETIKTVYIDAKISLPTLELQNNITDIDPFTVFGLFNKSSMKDENRKKIISSFAKVLSIDVNLPTMFTSLPVLNNQSATFYGFKGKRGIDDIDNLWNLFEFALKYASNPSDDNLAKMSKYFNIAIALKGNGNSKITMGLYWLAPETYLNLDKRNLWYIYETGRIPKNVVKSLPAVDQKLTAAIYFEIINKMHVYLQGGSSKLKDFKELSAEAWNFSEEVNKKKRKEEKRDPREPGLPDSDIDTVHYWIYSPGENASKWDEFYSKGIMAIGWGKIGDLKKFESKSQMKDKMKETFDSSLSYTNDAFATWQFANVMKKGDVVFVKKGRSILLGRGVVASDYYYDENVEDEYNNIRDVNWTNKGKWDHPGIASMKTLTDITSYTEYTEKLNQLFGFAEDEELEIAPSIKYSKNQFLKEVFMSASDYDNLVYLCHSKKNVILCGAPGVGKTYAAKRLAYSIIGCKDQTRVKMIQFHQSYSYEDFIEGYSAINYM